MSAQTTDELPSFLYGTFDWLINGLMIIESPPFDLCSRAALEHSNPWVVIAAIIEHAKRGEHRHAPRLARFFDADVYALDRSALLVTGMVATAADLGLLESALQSHSSQTRAFAATGAREAGSLKLVPAMLQAWRLADHHRDRRTIALAICDLLEPPGGSLLEESSIYNLAPVDPNTLNHPKIRAFAEARNAREPVDEQFPTMVNDRCAALAKQFGTVDICLWAGVPRHPQQLARACWDALPEALSSFDLVHYRRMFESSTGISCVDFFQWDRPKRLSIQATLENFLQTAAAEYMPGQRYFFGHPVA